MNPGILTPPTQFATMPRGLLGRPTPVPMIDARRVFDPDAERYIAAVERADGRRLEEAVRVAIGEFVIGCKEDGIWSAIKASCLLMGARTLSGALTPLVGSAPTNNGPFVSGDYNRRDGLTQTGGKWITSGRNLYDDPNSDCHCSVFIHSLATNFQGILGSNAVSRSDNTYMFTNNNQLSVVRLRSNAYASTSGSGAISGKLAGMSRSNTSTINARVRNAVQSFALAANQTTSLNSPLDVFRCENWSTSGTLSFYSFGTSIDLLRLDSRVSALYSAIRAAIP